VKNWARYSVDDREIFVTAEVGHRAGALNNSVSSYRGVSTIFI